MTTIEELVKKEMPREPDLSFARSDLEKRLLFPAGRFTSPGPLLPAVIAVLATVGLYAALATRPHSLVTQSFTQRGPVPYAIVFLSWWSLAILLVKHRKLALQRRALRLTLLPSEDPGFILTPSSAETVLQRLFQCVDDPRHFLLTRRIHNALANLKNMGRIGDADEVLRTQAENDEAQVDSSYTVLRGFIWAIPVLGFVGTVLGLSLALGAFGGVLAGAEQMDQLKTALQEVTGGLSTAFETTLQGLVAALGIHLLMVAMRRKEEQFLDDCKDYCQKTIVGRLRLVELSAGGGS